VDRIIVRHLPLVVTKKLIPVELLHFIQNSPLHGLVPLLLTILFLAIFCSSLQTQFGYLSRGTSLNLPFH
jgi:hypothetical protein